MRTIVVCLAVIIGWFWRVGMEKWPTWQPVMWLAGMILIVLLINLPAAAPGQPKSASENNPAGSES